MKSLLRSRILLPITAPPIEDGAVLISGDRIAAVGPWRELRRHAVGPVLDLGESLLLPGLINAHCHLDYTHFAGHLAPPRSFTEWIQSVMALKGQWSYSEYAASWLAGARQLLECGCTTVVDMEAVPELISEAWLSTPLRVISAIELIGMRPDSPSGSIVESAVSRLEGLQHPRHRGALAPHAPYSTRAELLRHAVQAARTRGWILSMHVAESAEEFAMVRHATGPMYDWLRTQRDMSDCGSVSPVRHVADVGLLSDRCVLAHVNYLDEGDVDLLAQSQSHVVHCPRSHEYFGHRAFPLQELRAAGVNVCLGTDSLLSVTKIGRVKPRLDLFAELAALARAHPSEHPELFLRMLTVNAARAIGRGGEFGELKAGALADCIALSFSGSADHAVEAVIHNTSPISRSMIGGVWVWPVDNTRTNPTGM